MNIQRALARGILPLVAAFGLVSVAAPAAAWEPTKPVEFIIPAGTGGGAEDARVLPSGHQLALGHDQLGQDDGGHGGRRGVLQAALGPELDLVLAHRDRRHLRVDRRVARVHLDHALERASRISSMSS